MPFPSGYQSVRLFPTFDFTALALKESLTPLALTSANLSHLLQITMKVHKNVHFSHFVEELTV